MSNHTTTPCEAGTFIEHLRVYSYGKRYITSDRTKNGTITLHRRKPTIARESIWISTGMVALTPIEVNMYCESDRELLQKLKDSISSDMMHLIEDTVIPKLLSISQL